MFNPFKRREPTTPQEPVALEATAQASKQAEEMEEAPPEREGGAISEPADSEVLRERIIDTLRTVFDPEIPVNIYDLGLVYDIAIDPEAKVHVRMTLTAPNCPVAGSLPGEVEQKVREVEGVREASLELVWEPPWTKDMLSEAAKLDLGM